MFVAHTHTHTEVLRESEDEVQIVTKIAAGVQASNVKSLPKYTRIGRLN